MENWRNDVDLWIPDGFDRLAGLGRATHVGVGAHQDDLEFMALRGILDCYLRENLWFGGVTCTDGAGSVRSGRYADFSDVQMKTRRLQEQRHAASIGDYAFMAQLGFSSALVKTAAGRGALVDDLVRIFLSCRAQVVYTHNPFDRHATHRGVLLAVLEALARLPQERRPAQVLGCEVWRGLDWLPEEFRIGQDVSAQPNLSNALNGVFDSQISGGKRYDLAVEGRRLANATFGDSHALDAASKVAYVLDMTPLIQPGGPRLTEFVDSILSAFSHEIREGLRVLG